MLRRLEIADRRLSETDAEDARILLYIAPEEAERKYLTEELGVACSPEIEPSAMRVPGASRVRLSS